MEKKYLRVLAKDIADGLALEMRDHKDPDTSASVSTVDLLLQELAGEVVGLLREARSTQNSSDEDVEARLQKAETHLRKLDIGEGDDTDDTGGRLPNLKYRKPKYKNVESVLKYIEGEEDRGGVKLVIMNFND